MFVVQKIAIMKILGMDFSVSGIMISWKNSPGHLRTLINSRYVSGTIVCYFDNSGEQYWTSSFAVVDIDNIK